MAPSSSMQQRSIGTALNRLRLSVVICCWIVGAALAVQLLVWSLSTYTNMRFAEETASASDVETTVVVPAESPREQRIRQARESELGIDLSPTADAPPPSEPVLSNYDRVFANSVQVAGGFGRCAMLLMLPLLMVAVVLCASTGIPGVERVVSALVWALVVAALVLPLGESFSLPWQHGGLTNYDHMIGMVDQVNVPTDQQASQTEPAMSSLVFFSRLGLLPAACIVGITLVGLRFCSGIEAGIAREDMRLDPALEREAGNISPSSLHAGRSSSALGQTLRSTQSTSEQKMPSASAVSAGETPKRLI